MQAQRKYNTSIRRENAYTKKKKNHLQSEGDVYVKVSATDEKKLIAFCQERNIVWWICAHLHIFLYTWNGTWVIFKSSPWLHNEGRSFALHKLLLLTCVSTCCEHLLYSDKSCVCNGCLCPVNWSEWQYCSISFWVMNYKKIYISKRSSVGEDHGG